MKQSHRWLHLIWGSAHNRAWVLPHAHMRLCHHIQADCRRQGLYLELVAAQSDHLHLLLRMRPHEDSRTIRTLLAHRCHSFVKREQPQLLQDRWEFSDWEQWLSARELGPIRRRILRQDFLHPQISLREELAELGLQAPSERCIVLGEILANGQNCLQ